MQSALPSAPAKTPAAGKCPRGAEATDAAAAVFEEEKEEEEEEEEEGAAAAAAVADAVDCWPRRGRAPSVVHTFECAA